MFITSLSPNDFALYGDCLSMLLYFGTTIHCGAAVRVNKSVQTLDKWCGCVPIYILICHFVTHSSGLMHAHRCHIKMHSFNDWAFENSQGLGECWSLSQQSSGV